MNRQLKASSESEIMDAFNEWDTEGRGQISTKELRSMLMRLPEKLKRTDVDEMIQTADPAGKGTIKFNGEKCIEVPALPPAGKKLVSIIDFRRISSLVDFVKMLL